MVIWRITGDEVGPDGNGAAHFETRSEAEDAIREYKRWRREAWAEKQLEGSPPMHVEGPIKIIVRNRQDLVHELDSAMGYGAS